MILLALAYDQSLLVIHFFPLDYAMQASYLSTSFYSFHLASSRKWQVGCHAEGFANMAMMCSAEKWERSRDALCT